MRGIVLVLPGGRYQVPLIRKLKARGYRVACADRSADCPGAAEADEFHRVGLDEADRLLDLARALRPCGILTDQTDSAVAVVAWLSEQMGLRGIGQASAALFTHKHRMREFGVRHGFDTPMFRLCREVGEALSVADDIGYPVVVKPDASQASKGVHRVDGRDAMAARFDDAMRHAGGDGVLVEQFIGGTEFTVEGFMTGAGHRTLGISEKRHFPESPMVACALRYTPDHPGYDYAALRHAHDAWMDRSGLPFGITHAEYKFHRGRFFLIEVAARGGGTGIASDIVPWISGYDCQERMLDAVLDGRLDGFDNEPAGRCALLEFFHWPPGRVRAVRGLDEARAMAGVFDVVLNRHPGADVPAPTDDTARAGYFVLLTRSEGELSALRERVLETVTVEME